MSIRVLALLAALALPSCDTERSPDGAAAPHADDRPVSSRDFVFSTHCGVENARIDGRWWHVVDPLYGDGGPGTGAPAAWDDPFQSGSITVQEDRAVFEAEGGLRVVLTPARPDAPVRLCR